MTAAPRLPAAWRLLCYDRLASTNDEAKRLAREGAAEGTVVWAREQSAGRGRHGRQWVGIPGNLFVSFVLRPVCLPVAASQLGFVAALALGDALGGAAAPLAELRCKWPNDVLLNGRKFAGILLESETRVSETLDWVVLGIGVNVVAHPTGTDYPTTSLHEEGCRGLDAAALLESFARHFLGWYETWQDDGFEPVRATWLHRAVGIGEAIVVRLDRQRVEGRFLGIEADGTLALETSGGARRIAAGDVFPASCR
jgi:BirA family transcriptional regulator, biotin operon repressor / biotin---[acetyl-CoA-carboxylase] ligase